jgi:hypothetical protein
MLLSSTDHDLDKIDELLNNLHDEFYFYAFENGVKWLNEEADAEFSRKYPGLVKAITDIMVYRNKDVIKYD